LPNKQNARSSDSKALEKSAELNVICRVYINKKASPVLPFFVGRGYVDCAPNKYCMRLAEIQPAKPKTPEEQRIASLKMRAKQAQQAVTAERARQQQKKSQQTLARVQQQITKA
jgi:hypothetical protein